MEGMWRDVWLKCLGSPFFARRVFANLNLSRSIAVGFSPMVTLSLSLFSPLTPGMTWCIADGFEVPSIDRSLVYYNLCYRSAPSVLLLLSWDPQTLPEQLNSFMRRSENSLFVCLQRWNRSFVSLIVQNGSQCSTCELYCDFKNEQDGGKGCGRSQSTYMAIYTGRTLSAQWLSRWTMMWRTTIGGNGWR